MTNNPNTAPPEKDQHVNHGRQKVEISGYVLDEDREFALRDTATTMDWLAMALERPNAQMIDIEEGHMAAMLRHFSRSIQNNTNAMPFGHGLIATLKD